MIEPSTVSVPVDRLRAGGLERRIEHVVACVTAGERVVPEHELEVGAREVDRACVAGCGVVERIEGGHGEGVADARYRRVGEPGDGVARCGSRVDRDTALGAGDGRCERVRRGDGPGADRLQGGAERTGPIRQGAVRRDGPGHVVCREMDRSGVPGGHVLERIQGGHVEGVGDTGRSRAREAAHIEVGGGSGGDIDADLAAVDARGDRVGRNDRLYAGGAQGPGEGPDAIAQGRVGREGRRPIGTRNVDQAGVAGRDILEPIAGGHREAVGDAGHSRVGEAGNAQVRRGPTVDDDADLLARDGRGDSVGCGDRPGPGRVQGDQEAVNARLTAGERVVPGERWGGIRTRDGDRTEIAGRRVAVGILRGDRDRMRLARHGRVGEAAYEEVRRDARVDGDRGVRAGDPGADCVGRGDGARAGCMEGRGEQVDAVVLA